MDGGSLKPVSIKLLYEGMLVQEDIYDADAARLLVKHGATLNADNIESIVNINDRRDTIYVSGSTYEELIQRSTLPEINSLRELEDVTGYAAVKDETFELLEEIARDKVVQQKALRSVSDDLSTRLEVTSPSTILSLINALAPVDEYLQRHCVNVSLLNGLLGRWLGLSKETVDRLVLIGLLHDCGKALVPAQVLNAPRKLSVIEFEVVKMHPVYSYELLTEFPEAVRMGARLHHEKISGTGYPNRASSKDIPLEARITAISDIYDAMVSQRAYKAPKSPFSVMAFLGKLRNTELDAGLADTFNRNMPLELMDKFVAMSDGTVGVVRSFDPDDIEYPMVEINDRVVKSSERWYCTSMYIDD